MEATLNFHIPLSIDELADLFKDQLSVQERLKLAQLLTDEANPLEDDEDSEHTKEQLIEEIKQAVREVNLAKKGQLQLPTLNEFLNEL